MLKLQLMLVVLVMVEVQQRKALVVERTGQRQQPRARHRADSAA